MTVVFAGAPRSAKVTSPRFLHGAPASALSKAARDVREQSGVLRLSATTARSSSFALVRWSLDVGRQWSTDDADIRDQAASGSSEALVGAPKYDMENALDCMIVDQCWL